MIGEITVDSEWLTGFVGEVLPIDIEDVAFSDVDMGCLSFPPERSGLIRGRIPMR